MTTKQTYLRLLRNLTDAELARSVASPSRYMRPIHLALHRIEQRRRARIAAYYADVEQIEGWA